ncbi:uncharacterized protein BKCO1_170007 [Diplodia corticola]|uniref:Uncharacterized protein n=1 Tax=Diplodia corticola TaxID=236234 RepID=A0A1J9S4F3_9PEZI|nr:uncharacterized protein BKCO1_170007 [Diplodia corticola]OJD35415.1 hypothetical protein BKCO1_170007 [Diplodia corticola]
MSQYQSMSTSEQDLMRRMDEYKYALDVSATSVARLERGIQHIGGHVELTNKLQILGINRPGGFAEHVYDLVRMKADETRGADDKYFVYHPDDFWHPAFHSLAERNGGLPASFGMKSNDLDQICLHMQALRSTLLEDAPFHLLIPTWDRLVLSEPLHFPKELQPLCIEGVTYDSQPLVTMNVPRAPRYLLRGVKNEVESEESAKFRAKCAIIAALAAIGWVSAHLVHSRFPSVPFWTIMVGLPLCLGAALSGPLGNYRGILERRWRVAPARIVGSGKRVEVEEIERVT